MSFEAIIFDCDGTLVDTEVLCAEVDVEIYHECGIHFKDTDEFLAEFIGVANENIVNILNARHGKSIDTAWFLNEFVKRALPRIDGGMTWYPESVDVVRRLAGQGLGMAVASNGKRDLVMKELEVAGYLNLIERAHVFCVEDTAHPKPAPDLYLMAAASLGADPKACIAVEDSAAGARAAVAAGLHVVGYTGFAHDKKGREAVLLKAGCHNVINDLADLIPLAAR
jgi:beta-phosphoglucomutase-like phosphatase (HAD superfamily)